MLSQCLEWEAGVWRAIRGPSVEHLTDSFLPFPFLCVPGLRVL